MTSKQILKGLCLIPICILIGYLLIPLLSQFEWPILVVILLAAFVLLYTVCLRKSAKKFDLFEPINFFTLIFIVNFIIRPLFIIANNYHTSFINEQSTKALITLALLYCAVAFSSFIIGYHIPLGTHLARKLPIPSDNWNNTKVKMIVIFYSVIGILCYILYMRFRGGLFSFLTNMIVLRGTEESMGYIIWGAIHLEIAAFIGWVYYTFKQKNRWIILLHCISIILLFATFGARAKILFILLSLMITGYYVRGKNIKVISVSLMLIFTIFFIVFFGTFRSVGLEEGMKFESYQTLPSGFIERLMSDFTVFDHFLTILEGVPSRLNYQYGKTFFSIFLHFIPRFLLPDKPVGAGYLFRERLTNTFRGGRGLSIIGELYVNFHVAGIITGMLLFGIFSKMIYAYLTFNQHNKGVILIYTITLIYFITHYTYGSAWLPIMSRFLIHLIPTILGISYINASRWHRNLGGH